MGLVVFLLLAAVVPMVLALVRGSRRLARVRAMTALAGRLGLEWSAVDLFDDAWQPFPLFGLGTARGVGNVLYGAIDGVAVRAFEYWYRADDRSRLPLGDAAIARTHRFSCAVVTLPASCPRLAVQRHDIAEHLLELAAGDVVELDLDAFNRRFAVRSEDRRFAVALLDQRMMEALMQLPEGVAVAVAEDRLLLIAPSLSPREVERLLRTAARLQRAVPHVLASLYPLREGFRPADAIATRARPDPVEALRPAREEEPTDPTGLWWF